MRGELQTTQTDLAAANADLKAREVVHAEKQAALEAERQASEAVQGELGSARTQLAAATAVGEQSRAVLAERDRELAQVSSELSANRAELEKLRDALGEAGKATKAAQEKAAAATAAAEQATAAATTAPAPAPTSPASERVAELEAQLARSAARLQDLDAEHKARDAESRGKLEDLRKQLAEKEADGRAGAAALQEAQLALRTLEGSLEGARAEATNQRDVFAAAKKELAEAGAGREEAARELARLQAVVASLSEAAEAASAARAEAEARTADETARTAAQLEEARAASREAQTTLAAARSELTAQAAELEAQRGQRAEQGARLAQAEREKASAEASLQQATTELQLARSETQRAQRDELLSRTLQPTLVSEMSPSTDIDMALKELDARCAGKEVEIQVLQENLESLRSENDNNKEIIRKYEEISEMKENYDKYDDVLTTIKRKDDEMSAKEAEWREQLKARDEALKMLTEGRMKRKKNDMSDVFIMKNEISEMKRVESERATKLKKMKARLKMSEDLLKESYDCRQEDQETIEKLMMELDQTRSSGQQPPESPKKREIVEDLLTLVEDVLDDDDMAKSLTREGSMALSVRRSKMENYRAEWREATEEKDENDAKGLIDKIELLEKELQKSKKIVERVETNRMEIVRENLSLKGEILSASQPARAPHVEETKQLRDIISSKNAEIRDLNAMCLGLERQLSQTGVTATSTMEVARINSEYRKQIEKSRIAQGELRHERTILEEQIVRLESVLKTYISSTPATDDGETDIKQAWLQSVEEGEQLRRDLSKELSSRLAVQDELSSVTAAVRQLEEEQQHGVIATLFAQAQKSTFETWLKTKEATQMMVSWATGEEAPPDPSFAASLLLSRRIGEASPPMMPDENEEMS
eukprot:TRINITY_DN10936_c1_g1_i2.p1 TRINITY_DN10936_c1_g1~~TRINITY_DN10936_c1_g1_i2.p1  ORF type:complete len:885 (+),score=240.80 TRINITY_DN10936_c1_g1_i2:610-3264(+)